MRERPLEKRPGSPGDFSGALEEDDGFQFVRKRPKMAALEPAQPAAARRRHTAGLRAGRERSLLSSGPEAMPHVGVDVGNMYRHISDKKIPTDRLQLLWLWLLQRQLDTPATSTRASPRSSATDPTADEDALDARWARLSASERAAARSALARLRDRLRGGLSLSWYRRRPDAPFPGTPATVELARRAAAAGGEMQPNPVNVQNQARLERISRDLARWRSELAEWQQQQAALEAAPLAAPPLDVPPPEIPLVAEAREVLLRECAASERFRSAARGLAAAAAQLEAAAQLAHLRSDTLLDRVASENHAARAAIPALPASAALQALAGLPTDSSVMLSALRL